MNDNSMDEGSIWADCAKCESPNTSLGPVDEDCPIICEDCGTETEGINKIGPIP